MTYIFFVSTIGLISFILMTSNSPVIGQSFKELGEIEVEVDSDESYNFNSDIIRFIDTNPNAYVNTADVNDEIEVDNGDDVVVEVPIIQGALKKILVSIHNGDTLDISGENYKVSTLNTSLERILFNGDLGIDNRISFEFPENIEKGNYQLIVKIQPTNQSEAFYVTDLTVD
jgi:hypothetical protein